MKSKRGALLRNSLKCCVKSGGHRVQRKTRFAPGEVSRNGTVENRGVIQAKKVWENETWPGAKGRSRPGFDPPRGNGKQSASSAGGGNRPRACIKKKRG